MSQLNKGNVYESPEMIDCSEMLIYEPQTLSVSVAGSINITTK